MRKRLEFVDKFPQTIVSESKSIRNFLFQAMVGYLKRLMAAQGEEGRMPGLVSIPFFYLAVEVLESNVIVYSPWVFPFFHAEIYICCQLLVSAAQQITLHVGEVDIASIQKICGIALFPQFPGNRRQGAAFGGRFHDGNRREALVSAEGTDRTSVGSETVGITISKEDSFLAQALQIRTDTGYSS